MDEQQHIKEFEWHDHLLRSKSYYELIDYLNTSLSNQLPFINYPRADTINVLLTIASISSHFHQFSKTVNDDDLSNISLRAMEVLSSLVCLASSTTNSNDDDDTTTTTDYDDVCFSKPVPSMGERQLLLDELFKLLSLYQGDDDADITRKMRYRDKFPQKQEEDDDDDDDDELTKKSPLKTQLDRLFNDIKDEENTGKRKLEFHDKDDDDDDLKLNKNNKRVTPLDNDNTIYGYKLLHEQLNNNFWKLLRWGLKNASSSNWKSQCIWQSWKPIINFFIDCAILQFENVYNNTSNIIDNKSHLQRHHVRKLMLQNTFIYQILKKCNQYDESQALDEFIKRVFINEITMNTDYITPIYQQELKKNYKFVMSSTTCKDDDDDTRLGLSSMVTRKNLLYLAYRFINVNFLSVKDTKFHNSLKNSREHVMNKFLTSVELQMVELSFIELREFFIEDSELVLKNFKMEFLAQLIIKLLHHYSNIVIDDDDDDDDLASVIVVASASAKDYTNNTTKDDDEIIDILYDDSFHKLSNLQFNTDPFNYIKSLNEQDQSFTKFYQTYEKITLLISILLDMWFKLNKVETNSTKWHHFVNILQKGDSTRAENLTMAFNHFQKNNLITPIELKRYKQGEFQLIKLRDIFCWKFEKFQKPTTTTVVEDSE